MFKNSGSGEVVQIVGAVSFSSVLLAKCTPCSPISSLNWEWTILDRKKPIFPPFPVQKWKILLLQYTIFPIFTSHLCLYFSFFCFCFTFSLPNRLYLSSVFSPLSISLFLFLFPLNDISIYKYMYVQCPFLTQQDWVCGQISTVWL